MRNQPPLKTGVVFVYSLIPQAILVDKVQETLSSKVVQKVREAWPPLFVVAKAEDIPPGNGSLFAGTDPVRPPF
jgi:ABC-type sugar transport system substrate-binding protein